MRFFKNLTQYFKMLNLDKLIPKWEVFITALANLNPLNKINTLMLVKLVKDKSCQSSLC